MSERQAYHSPESLRAMEAMRAALVIGTALLMFHSLWTFLDLIEISAVRALWLFVIALGCGVFAVGWSSARQQPGRLWVRAVMFLALVLAGPLSLQSLHSQPGKPGTFVLYGLAGLISLCLGPEWVTLYRWFRGFILFPSEGRQDDLDDSGLRSWLLTAFAFLLPLGLIAVSRPYIGRLGAHVLVGASLVLWIFPWERVRRRVGVGVLAVLWCGGHLLYFALAFAWPWPQSMGDNEIIYTDMVVGQGVTLHARKTHKRIYYTVTTKNSIIHTSITAYRQAEMLVHPAMALAPKSPPSILILGSEDGAVMQEINKYPHTKRVVWTPLFPFWRSFFEHAPILARNRVVSTPSTKIIRTRHINQLEAGSAELLTSEFGRSSFDVIFADLPKVFAGRHHITTDTYQSLLSLLKPKGILAVQLASPYTQPDYYWCLVGQWVRAGAHVVPYQLSPSSYQDFGYALISKERLNAFAKPLHIPVPTQYLYASQPLSVLARFAKDSLSVDVTASARCRP